MNHRDQVGKRISRAIREAADRLCTKVPHLKTLPASDRRHEVALNLSRENALLKKIEKVLEEDHELGRLCSGWIQLDGTGHVVQGFRLATILIERVLANYSVNDWVKDACSFSRIGRSAAVAYVPIAGVKLAGKVSLGKNIDLIPWAKVPDGYQKTEFGTAHERWFGSFGGILKIPAVPTCAVRFWIEERQVLFMNDGDAKDSAGPADSVVRWEKAQDVVRCLTALSVRPLAAVGHWTDLNNRIAREVFAPGMGISETIFDKAVESESTRAVSLDKRSFAKLYRRFEELEASSRNVLRIGLDRLNQALRRGPLVEKAIDLGIALESMLLDGKDSGELRFRMALRGASLIGKAKKDRQELFELLKSAYDLRSSAVHTGRISGKKSKAPPPADTLNAASAACASIARKLISRGSFPKNWETEIVI